MPSNLPSFKNYGDYSSSNYGAHSLCFTDAQGITYYFSYQTLVAFEKNGQTVCRENAWGHTTGRHLNWIEPNHKARVDQATFEEKLREATQCK